MNSDLVNPQYSDNILMIGIKHFYDKKVIAEDRVEIDERVYGVQGHARIRKLSLQISRSES